MRYGLELLLYRIQAAGHSDTFVLKGAMLFVLWRDVPGRLTRDLDLLGIGELNHDRLRAIFADACRAKVADDGLRFDSGSIQTEDIRDDQEYHGVRIRLLGFLGRAHLAIQVDIGIGDSLKPASEEIDYPAILAFPAPSLDGVIEHASVRGIRHRAVLPAVAELRRATQWRIEVVALAVRGSSSGRVDEDRRRTATVPLERV